MAQKLVRQTAFNRFWKVFVVEKRERSVGAYSPEACLYKRNGHGCGIGIQPEFQAIYRPEMEGSGIQTLYSRYSEVREIIAKEDLGFFAELQNLHDRRENWVDDGISVVQVKSFASDHNLKIPYDEGGMK